MKGRICIFAVLAVFVLSWTIVSGNMRCQADREGDGVIDKVFYDSGCDFLYLNVNGWAMVNRDYVCLDDLKKIAMDAARFFEIDKENTIFTDENEFLRQVNVHGINEKGQVVTIVVTNSSPEKRNPEYETYIVIDITDNNKRVKSAYIKQGIKKYFNCYGIAPQVFRTFVGTFPGKLNGQQKEMIYRDLFKKAGATIIEGVEKDGLVSKTGYSSLLTDYVVSAKKKVNFNVALRYNYYEDRTYLWVGTPLVNMEY